MQRILYISGAVGLGHVIRDLAIAHELRRIDPNLDITWLGSPTVNQVFREAGEKLHPEAGKWADETAEMEKVSAKEKYHVNLIWETVAVLKGRDRNVGVFKEATNREAFDLVIGDEAYEIHRGILKDPKIKKAPFVYIQDFIGMDSMSKNPLEKLGTYICNREWAKDYGRKNPVEDLLLFVGEEEDLPDKKFGFLLPNRREYARDRSAKFIGYILPFQPTQVADSEAVKKKLGYAPVPLVICSIGGTSVGQELLNLCGRTYSIVKERVPDLHLTIVCGPRLSSKSFSFQAGIEVREYVPNLYEHFAACDLAVVQGGGTSTLELTALRRPFIFFPLEGHSEQQIHVAARLARQKAGIKLLFSQTTPEILAETIVRNIGQKVTWPLIRTDGAQRAAGLIHELLMKQK